MNKAELSARTATETSQSRASADDAVTPVFSIIDDALASGEFDRNDGFGTFSMRSRPTRQGRHPCARARASPSPPQRRLPSRSARHSARPSASGFGEGEYRCRIVPMRTGMNGKGKSSGSVSAPPVRCRSPETQSGDPSEADEPNRKSLRCERHRKDRWAPSHDVHVTLGRYAQPQLLGRK